MQIYIIEYQYSDINNFIILQSPRKDMTIKSGVTITKKISAKNVDMSKIKKVSVNVICRWSFRVLTDAWLVLFYTYNLVP